jgi:hypothetical protein
MPGGNAIGTVGSSSRLGPVGQRMKTPRLPLLWAAAIALVALNGCSSLLPQAKKETVSGWNSYDEARQALAVIEPYKTVRPDLHVIGLDPRINPNITVLHYADVVQRFSAAALMKPEEMDSGIRDCLRAGRKCSGYAIVVKKLDRNRVGNFWLDSFHFKRETMTVGWSVDALLVFVDDMVVYQLIGGQPTISEYEQERNPLGPLQGWGDQFMQYF